MQAAVLGTSGILLSSECPCKVNGTLCCANYLETVKAYSCDFSFNEGTGQGTKDDIRIPIVGKAVSGKNLASRSSVLVDLSPYAPCPRAPESLLTAVKTVIIHLAEVAS